VIWANLHGSFAIGLAMLGLYAAGEVLDCWFQHKSLAATLKDRSARTWALACPPARQTRNVNTIGRGETVRVRGASAVLVAGIAHTLRVRHATGVDTSERTRDGITPG
jgi:hypothetical protein